MWMNASFSYVIKQSHHQQNENDSVCIWDIIDQTFGVFVFWMWKKKETQILLTIKATDDWQYSVFWMPCDTTTHIRTCQTIVIEC